MLKQDGTLGSFSPCIEQVQRSCETLRSHFTDIWTFEILLRMYEIRDWKMDHLKVNDGNPTACTPRTRRLPSSEASVGDNASSPTDKNLRAYRIFDIRKCQKNTIATAGY